MRCENADEEVGPFNFHLRVRKSHSDTAVGWRGKRSVQANYLPRYVGSDVLMKECLLLSLYCIIFGNRNNIHMHFLSNLTEMESYP